MAARLAPSGTYDAAASPSFERVDRRKARLPHWQRSQRSWTDGHDVAIEEVERLLTLTPLEQPREPLTERRRYDLVPASVEGRLIQECLLDPVSSRERLDPDDRAVRMTQIQHRCVDHLDHRDHVLGLARQRVRLWSLACTGTPTWPVEQMEREDLGERVTDRRPPAAVSSASVYRQQRRLRTRALNAHHWRLKSTPASGSADRPTLYLYPPRISGAMAACPESVSAAITAVRCVSSRQQPTIAPPEPA